MMLYYVILCLGLFRYVSICWTGTMIGKPSENRQVLPEICCGLAAGFEGMGGLSRQALHTLLDAEKIREFLHPYKSLWKMDSET